MAEPVKGEMHEIVGHKIVAFESDDESVTIELDDGRRFYFKADVHCRNIDDYEGRMTIQIVTEKVVQETKTVFTPVTIHNKKRANNGQEKASRRRRQ